MHAVWIADDGDDALTSRSDWVLLTSGGSVLDRPDIADNATAITSRPDWRLWTDDFNNLFQVLKARE